MIQKRRPASGLLRWATWRNAIACRPLRTKRNRTSAARHRPRPSPSCRSLRRRARCMPYIYRNRRRMRYSQFRKQGFCTSSGVVEAGCKVAIGTRIKRAGMHWTLDGANAIIALRCRRLSARFEDFRERRNDPIAA